MKMSSCASMINNLWRVPLVLSLAAAISVAGCGGGGGGGGGGAETLTLVETKSMPASSTSGPYVVDIPNGAVSLTIIADGGDAGDMDISSIVDASGFSMISADPYNYPIGENLAQGYGQSAVAFTVPHSLDYSFHPGKWSFSITHYSSPADAAKDVSIYTIVKTAAGTKLNVNVWIVALPDYTGENDPNVKAMMDEFKRIMALNGFTVGSVAVHVLDNADAQRLTNIDLGYDGNQNDQSDDMDELFKMSAQAGNDYMNLFFVRSLSESGVLGIAGGIPGPPILQGTEHSGVLVNTMGGLSSLSSSELLMQGATVAHELGHYMGLFHTTESGGGSFDPISDTPECPASVFDTDGDGLVSAEECVTRDGANLMFWASAWFTQETLSSAQKSVVSFYPAVK